MPKLYNSQRMSEILGSNTPESLLDIYEIEDVAMYIKHLDDEISFYELLKKKKKRDIELEINNLDNRKQFLKKIILKTLEKNNKKSLNFPGSCKIKTSKGQNKWTIENEEDFIKFLKENNEYDRCVDKVTQFNIVKKEANKLLEAFDKVGKVPECVDKKDAEPVISITYVEEDQNIESKESVKIPIKEEDIKYDELGF